MKGTHRCHPFVLRRVIGVMRMIFTIWNDDSLMVDGFDGSPSREEQAPPVFVSPLAPGHIRVYSL